MIGPGKDGVVYKTADFHKPWTIGVTPDAAIQAKIDELNAQLAPIFGTADRQLDARSIPRADQCGGADRTDVRVARSATSSRTRCATAYAIGYIRAHELGRAPRRPDMPDPDLARRLLPVLRARRRSRSRAVRSLGVLPFGNIVVTMSVNGAELKTMLENGVSRMPASTAASRRSPGSASPTTSRLAAGSRVTAAVMADCGRQLHCHAGRPDGGQRRTRSPRTTSRRAAATAIRTSPAARRRRTSWSRSRPTTSRRIRR